MFLIFEAYHVPLTSFMTSPSRKIDPATTIRGECTPGRGKRIGDDRFDRDGQAGSNGTRVPGQRFRLGRACVRCARHDKMADRREERREHPRDVLVAHGGEHHRPHGPAIGPQIGRERGGAGRVVGGVEQQLAPIGEPTRFKPSWPLRIGEPGSDRMSWDANAVRIEDLEQTNRDRRVRLLMRTREANREVSAIRRRRPDELGAALARDPLDDGGRLGLERPDDNRDAGLDDARLLERDFPQRGAEVLLMLERD